MTKLIRTTHLIKHSGRSAIYQLLTHETGDGCEGCIACGDHALCDKLPTCATYNEGGRVVNAVYKKVT